jgi:predicted RND superfamily exporter protein
VVESTVNVGVVMITAGLIAAAGLLTLTLFPIRGIQIFGLMSGAGILSALVIEMTFIPACRTLLPAPKTGEMAKEKHGGVLETVLEKMAGQINVRPWLPLAAAALVLAAAIVGASRIEVENSFRKALPADEPALQDYETLNDLFGGTVTLNILVDGREPDALYDPELLRAMEGMQTFLTSIPGIGRTLSIVDYVKQLNVAFNGGDESFRRIPDSREAVAQFFLLYSGDPDDFDMMVDSENRLAILRAFSKSDSADFCNEVFLKARKYADEHFPEGVRVGVAGGGLAIGKAVNDVIMREKFRNMLIIAAIIFLVASFVLRSFVGGFLVLTPSLFAAIVNLGVMGWVGTWLNLATASISSLTVSIGADYAIYFLFRFREEFQRSGDIRETTLTTMLTSGKAIFFVASAISAGSLVMALSPLSYHQQLGTYVAISMFTSALAAVTVIPAVVILCKPKFLRKQKASVSGI